eukprot:917125-Pelagomonas_calceolata.AAC.1
MREPLVYGPLLIVEGGPAVSFSANEWQKQLAWRALSCACMHEGGMVCCRKVRLLPQALHINATSVSGRTGFANFSASLATLPSLLSSFGEHDIYGILMVGM